MSAKEKAAIAVVAHTAAQVVADQCELPAWQTHLVAGAISLLVLYVG